MKKQLLLATTSVAVLAYGVPALADCLPNAGGTTVTCNINDPDGYNGSTVNGLTINVEPEALVEDTLSTGQNSAVNNEGEIDASANSGVAISVGGGSTVSNAFTAQAPAGLVGSGGITGDIVFGAAGTNQTNTLNNANVGIGIVGDISSAGGAFIVNNSGDIVGNISSVGNLTLSNTAAGTVDGSVSSGAGTDSVTNAGTITGNVETGGAADAVTNSGTIDGYVDLGEGDNTLTNTATGVINDEVYAGAGNDTITNHGYIDGDIEAGDGNNIITNSATGIVGDDVFAGSGNDTLTNAGNIADDVNLGDGNNTITNSGIIGEDVFTGSGNDVLTNSGTIGDGASVVDLGDGNNTLDNSGTIDADVFTGSGNDTITNTGTITGNIDVGAGTNLVTFSDASQFPGGGLLTADAAGDSTLILTGTGTETMGLTVTNFDRLRKQGTGTWTLTDANSYSDAIYVEAGTLDTTDADSFGANKIVNNAAVTITGAGSGTYSGNMSGTGTLAISNTGTTTLSGANTFTGGTTITGGTTVLTGGAALADTGAVTVTSPGVLQVDTAETIGSLAGSGNATLNATLTTGGNNASTTYSGVASGAGGLTKAGTGNMTLTGVNTFTGALTVNGGTLTLNEAGGNAIADTVAATVGTGATLALSTNETLGSLAGAGTTSLGANTLTTGGDNTSTTYSGVISGTGAVVKTGTGTMTLTGANTYTGGTTLSAGGITGTTSGIVGNYSSAAGTLLTFSQTTNGTYAGNAALLGALAKSGSGAVTTTGTISAAEGTTVSGGRLNVNGTLTSDVAVGTGAVIGGTGTITGDVTVTGGTTAPGNSIGTLNIDGDLTHDAASTLQIEVAMVGGVLTSDRINVTGDINAAGTLAFVPATGFYRNGQSVTFAQAGAINGSFGTVTGLTPNQFITFTVGAGTAGTDVTRTLTAARATYTSRAQTANQIAVAGALDAAVTAGVTAGSAMEGALTALDYTANAAAARAAYDQMSGEIYGSFVSAGQWAGDAFQAQIDRRVRDQRAFGAADGTGMQVWFRLYNYWNSMDSKNNLEGFDVDTFGGALGFDTQISEGFTAGLALGYSKSDLDSDLLGRDGDVKSYQIGAYASGSFMESGFVDASLFYASNNGDMTRSIAFGTFSGAAAADVDSDEFRGRLAAGFNVGTEELRFRPYGALEYSSLKVDGFTETGANALNLTVSDINGDRFIGEVGLELDGSFGGGIVPSAYAAYRHAFDRDDRVFSAVFAGSAASSHTLIGQDGKKGLFAFGVALGGQISDGVFFSVDYDGEFNGTQTSHAIGGGIRASF